ncbi:gas vesicle protein [Streptomyces sp. TR1341]|uniref:gas vesicle protein GvpO n=1 Tax=Streptomyces TaxID=1883 RepID=UPI00138AFD04|nr:gas vesicle protein [Streptomyces murinus]NDK29427.1 gas vesicle protein [Streptomyces sp. TR1341]WSI90243.1 gas vesicle protein [Streptomyces murinus]WUD11867.1 gas vesicle protein [Streptomyces murinus]
MSNTHRTTRTQNSRDSQKEPEREEEREARQEIEQEPEAEPRKTRKGSRPSPGGEESIHEPEGRRPPLMEVLRRARGQLAELTGLEAESVSSFEQTEDGWSLEVEVLELSRVPDTMSLMGGYQVELDRDGQLTGYRRVRRYERGRADPRPGGH